MCLCPSLNHNLPIINFLIIKLRGLLHFDTFLQDQNLSLTMMALLKYSIIGMNARKSDQFLPVNRKFIKKWNSYVVMYHI